MPDRDSHRIELRVDRFVRERLQPASVVATASVALAAWEAPDEPVPFEEVPHDAFTPFRVGTSWGKPWGTTWFEVSGTVPVDWDAGAEDIELKMDLGFSLTQPGFQAEGLVWSPEGVILKALEPFNDYVRLGVRPGDPFRVYVEAASNPDIGAGFIDFRPSGLGRKSAASSDALYALRQVELLHRDPEVGELIADVWTLRGLAKELPEGSPRRAAILTALDEMVDVVDPTDVSGTASTGRAALAGALASPAAATAHTVYAVGHAHIDSAWLWPVRETIRKCARTFSNVLDLMEQDPDFTFACSSAQQFAWIRDGYPKLFERVRARVLEGRFIPVGGMWVESDTNMPGGEALVRQFIEGHRFFFDEFGLECREVWLPDSFGHSGALPQIARAAGADSFLTQKLSWNEVNQFPHHTFLWEGIDGTRIFTHFPPVDTYSAVLSGGELAHAERNFRDKGHANTSLVPFGFGDGGGGPTREMIAAARRTRSLEGSPRVLLSTPSAFFDDAKRELAVPAVWVGELYLEFHRGTYTSQARTKRGNRRSEHLLHEAELWAATATVRTGADYPYEQLEAAWRLVLLQQFHDILPGSSIGWVHDQAVQNYERIADALEGIITTAIAVLTGEDGSSEELRLDGAELRLNGAPVPVDGVPAFGFAPMPDHTPVPIIETDTGYTIDNGVLRVVLDSAGLVTSLLDVAADREVVPPGQRLGILQLFQDTPTTWDAWDIDVSYRASGSDLIDTDSVSIVTLADGTSALRTIRTVGSSTVIAQTISLGAGSNAVDYETRIDWRERQRMLKLAFPVDVHADAAASEIQFGHIVRPTHTNTSWDLARFETPAHRWVHVGEEGFGVGVANDSTYGHDITRHARSGGGTYSVVRQTLLRAPLFPDPEADQGEHTLRTAIVVGDIGEAMRQGYRLNIPVREVVGVASDRTAPLARSDRENVVVETVKLAEDRTGDVVIRLYEARGARSTATIRFGFPFATVRETDLFEREVAASVLTAGAREVTVDMRPFQLMTLRVTRG
ncbi:alpha-mannosidase [Micromonospora sp. DT81.3]|uniref:alpha-mannosidase n=1 Tax=Micromonospora sp. DT81.3 TaxID=3416523 RepID=UPI003CED28D2